MRDELYVKVAERYKERVRNFEKKYLLPDARGYSYGDMARNLLWMMGIAANDMQNPRGSWHLEPNRRTIKTTDEEEKERLKRMFNENRNSLRIYLNLLEGFPEFRESEIHSEEYCPGLTVQIRKEIKEANKKGEHHPGPHRRYVEIVDKMLRSKK
jgi:hypothetical protein